MTALLVMKGQAGPWSAGNLDPLLGWGIKRRTQTSLWNSVLRMEVALLSSEMYVIGLLRLSSVIIFFPFVKKGIQLSLLLFWNKSNFGAQSVQQICSVFVSQWLFIIHSILGASGQKMVLFWYSKSYTLIPIMCFWFSSEGCKGFLLNQEHITGIGI